MTTVEKDPRPRVKRLVVGTPMPTRRSEDTLLPKRLALPIFASDALSSVAYATEAALVVLLAASATGRSELLPVSLAIAALLAVVIASYQQTVRVYESSGGAYVVAKDNLGTLPSLVGAAALLTDYVLTVAVSISAGVVALVSAVPAFAAHRVALSLVFIAMITIGNLRGVRESGLVFALPTYAFILSMLVLVVAGAARCADGTCGPTTAPQPMTVGAGAIGLFVLLRAFASGSTALTGVEAIANGVGAFRRPQARNAARTLGILGALAITFFLGVSYLAIKMHATPNEGGYPSVVSQIARVVFPGDSPTELHVLRRSGVDRRDPRSRREHRVPGLPAACRTPRTRPLLPSTVHQPRRPPRLLQRDPGSRRGRCRPDLDLRRRRRSAHPPVRDRGLHGVHALADRHGALLASHARPGLALAGVDERHGRTRHLSRHARRDLDEVRGGSLDGDRRHPAARAGVLRHPPALPQDRSSAPRRHGRSSLGGHTAQPVLIVPDSVDVATESALWYAHRIGHGEVRAVHAPGHGSDVAIRPRWYRLAARDPQLEILDPSEGRIDAVLEELWKLPRGERDVVTVVIPEQFRRPSLLTAARRAAFRLKLRLLSEPGVVVADVPVISDRHRPQGHTATTLIARILVADVNAASMRALNYAQSLDADDLRAVYFATGADEARELGEAWARADTAVPLDVLEAPYRDIGDPLLGYIRELTSKPDVAVNVVMPELVLHGWARFLHNQRALYIKRLLLFEPGVILTSVPYQLFR